MLERELVVVVSSFEAVLCHANPTTLSYQSTSGTKETKTPISRSSGQLSRAQALTGETRPLQFMSDREALHSIR